jgi:glycerol-3-phosphate dehydrogenase (NAD(P)+)
MRCVVLGGGSWGTALASQLARAGHDTVLWERHPDRAAHINAHRSNPRYLKGVMLPEALRAETDLGASVRGRDLIVPSVPSHALREVLLGCKSAISDDAVISCATKGIEENSLMTMHEVMSDVLPAKLHGQLTMLYGPSFALEVARDSPTAVVCAGAAKPAELAAQAFHSGHFRAYHTDDVIGVCIGGSLKNVMAIACGVSDGVGLGSNARAALITRGLAEITRLAVARGANPLTMMGLAGMGDLVLTCTGNLSRNRRVGLALGEGRTLNDILEELGEVAEGVRTAKSAWTLSQRAGVEMPITEQIFEMLYKDKPVRDALGDLMSRNRRSERDS